MKNSSKIIIYLFLLLNSRLYAENIDNLEEKSFFCCSIYDLYKTDSSEEIVESAQLKNANKDLGNEIEILKVSTTVSEESFAKNISEENISIEPKKVNEKIQVGSDVDTDLIHIEADESYWHENKQLTILQGDTKIIRGNEIIKGELTNFLQLENRARLSGNVQYNADGMEVKAPYAEYNTRESRTDFISPEYKFSSLNISGKARYGVRLKNKKMFLKNATYTTCDLINPDWNLISKTTELDFQEGVGTGKNVFVTIKGVPVFYTPYMRFSLDEQRKTGFLVPEWSGSWAKGPDVFTPFYWNIATNMDMLIQPSYIQERGSQIESNFRYLNESYNGSMYVSYLANDSLYSSAHGLDDEDRYKLLLDHRHQVNEYLLTNIHYERVSDKDYYNDFSTGIYDASKSYGSRFIEAIYEKDDWRIYGEFLGYQTYDKTLTSASQPYDLLPKIEVSKRWERDFANFDIWTSYTKLDHNHKTKVDGTRADIQIGFDKTFDGRGISITPRFKVQHTAYDLNNQTNGFTSSPSKTIPIFSLDNQLTLSKKIQNTKIAHQIKPRIFYLYSREENQDDIPIFDTGLNHFSYSQLFRDNSFSGADRTSDANQITLSLSSSFYDLTEYRNIFTASLGRIIYFEDRNISIDNNTTYNNPNSKIIGELEYNPSDNISLISTFLYDTNGKNKKTEENIHTFQYRGKGNNVLNARYRYIKNGIEQGDVSFAWGINNHLNILGRWNYDFKNNSYGENSGDIETLAGLEYESCCWKARLVQRKFKVDAETYEKDIQFQIMLKGFTDVGTPLGDLIADSIKGYMEEEY